ncbi:hypothetical protein E3C22_16745 [Jiella endophytica]|uniref:DUF4365 domain-containing protein n=1 Tax=Jiella endophytica TaxID=2558362 RepID=A0A4Y8RE31_9HYPH|nr:hypothetical protein [Jiella endophytica]TFF20556.1 hypothetical protein E3C22_16745 [Jiella endophytica]
MNMKSRRPPLGNDLQRIGDIGENKFKDLCDKAGLHCSKPVPDRTGKDWLVEFPLEGFDILMPYDKRPAAKCVVVQVKTVTSTKRPVTMKLSAAERLAKDLKPAVVCMMVYDRDEGEVIEARFVHILGDNLASILKRLRKGQKRMEDALHKLTIGFGADKGFEVPLTKEGFYDALSAVAAPSMDRYAAEKQRQIDTVGYGFDRLSGKLKFFEMSREDLADVFLGIKQVPLRELQISEKRFDIELPFLSISENVEGAMVSIEPEPVTECILSTVDPDSQEIKAVPSKLYAVEAAILGDGPAALYRWAMGEIKVDFATRKLTVKLQVKADGERPIAEWLSEFGFINELLSGERVVTAASDRGQVEVGKLNMNGVDEPDWFRPVLQMLEKYDGVFREAGGCQTSFSLQSLIEDRNRMAAISLMDERTLRVEANVSEIDGDIGEEGVAGLFIAAVCLAGQWVSIAAPTRVWGERDNDSWKLRAFSCARPTIELLQSDDNDEFHTYVERCRKLRGAECVIVQEPGKFLASECVLVRTDLQ